MEAVRVYYNHPQTLRKFSLWAPDPKRPGVSAAHMGLNDVERFHKDVVRRTLDILRHRKAVERMTKFIVAEAQVASGHLVLDSGCGTGAVTFPIAEQNPRSLVFGISLSHGQLEAAQGYQQSAGIKNTFFSEQDFTKMAFRDNSLDRVIFVESFCHAADKKATILEVNRVLKPGGKLIIFDAMYDRAPSDEHRHLCDALGSTDGLAMPDLPVVADIVEFINGTDLETEHLLNLTPKIKASLALIANGYITSLLEGRAEPSPVIDSYLAWHLLTAQGPLGYAVIRAVKSSN